MIGDKVYFRWCDSAHGNKKKQVSLPTDEFLRRFLLHLLPRGFVRIRNFAILANLLPNFSSALHHRSAGCSMTLHLEQLRHRVASKRR